MTDYLQDFEPNEQQLRRRRRYLRITRSLLAFLIALSLINVYIALTIMPSAVISSGVPFVGWKVRSAIIVITLLLFPASCLLVASLLAIIPVRTGTYLQRMIVIFLILAVCIQGFCLEQLVETALHL